MGLVRRNRRGRPRHIEGFLDGNTKKSRRGDTGNLRFFYREEEAAPDRERDAAYRDWLGKYRLADNAKNRREWELKYSQKNNIISAYGNADRNSYKVDIHSVLSDALRDAEYVPKGTTAEKGGAVSPDCIRSIFGKLNSDKENGALFDVVFGAAERLGLDFTFENRRRITPTLSSVLGEAEGERIRFFMPSLNGKGNEHVSRVILHELIHGVTEYAHQAAKAGEFSDSITVNLSVAVERPQS